MKKDLFEKEEERIELSASSLKEEFIISDPAEYVNKFRQSFLKWAREKKGLAKTSVCSYCHITSNELDRVEKGNISEKDMMLLSKLAKLYGVSYHYLIALFRLARRPQKASLVKLAAYHDTDMDEATQKKVAEFILKLKEASK